jgi:heme/copper-type cytochrome/quinol oxidase subunit 2
MRPLNFKFLFVILFAVLLVAFTPIPFPKNEPTHHVFDIDSRSFAFSPAEIKVNQGDLVTINLTSSDVVHGLYLDGYDLEVSTDPGQTSELTFTADWAGSFRFRCSVTCGDLHPFMIGKLQVGPNQLLWRAAGLAILAALVGVWRFRQ